MNKMLVAIDDTDSTKGMCTTYLAAKLIRRLSVTDTPRLIRLNPNIPYKTRGNGAVAFKTVDGSEKEIISYVEKHSMLEDNKTNPGIVFLYDEKNVGRLNGFYRRAVSELVTIEDAEEEAKKVGAVVHKIKNGRGIIGALASLGFKGDRTYEIIAYRTRANWGTPRRIDDQSVHEMDKRLYPQVFDNIGPDGKRILISPRGYDPIFCGIRGTSKNAVEAAWKMIKPMEPVEFTQVFETNQATDAHLRKKTIDRINPYDCVIVPGKITRQPRTIPGGHVIFTISDETGSIDCAAYKKSGKFRDTILQLAPGDEVTVSGGMSKYPNTINLEKIEVRKLAVDRKSEHPLCCRKNMTSAGKNKGYKCKKCGKKISQKDVKVSQGFRSLESGIYDAPPGSRRHLSRPVFLG